MVTGPLLNRTSAECNQAIMFVTDGIEGEYAGKESFERNNKDKRVRVFSYLVGRFKSPDKKALIKMSCDNGGYFYEIETLGNIWDTVLDYLRVMSRPLTEVYRKDQAEIKPTYTPAYLDSAGFGMVMTISLNVFKKREEKDENGDKKIVYEDILGVAGTDIALKNLKDQVDLSKMGSFSRAFIINNNGFILTHPKFREQTGYLPVPPNIQMEDLEYSIGEEATELKDSMLMLNDTIRSEAVSPFKTMVLYDNNRKVFQSETQYYIKKILGADLVSAVALSDKDEKYLAIDKTMLKFDEFITAGKNALQPPIDDFDYEAFNMTKTNTSFVTVAPWNYCDIKVEKMKGVKTYPTSEELYQFLKNPDNLKDCDEELINRLLIMAGALDKVTTEIWDKIKHHDDAEAVLSTFVATTSGYQKYLSFHNLTNVSSPYNRDILKTKVIETPAAAMSEGIKMFFSSPSRDKKSLLSADPVPITIIQPYKKEGVLGIGKTLQILYTCSVCACSTQYTLNPFHSQIKRN
jgi:Cache domain.